MINDIIIGINHYWHYLQLSCQNLYCFKKNKIKIFLVTIHIFFIVIFKDNDYFCHTELGIIE